METISAKWQRAGRRGKTPRVIVIHCTVSPEMGTGAEAVARYFQTTTRPGSTQLVSDNNSTVRCVADEDTAYGAAGANNDGLHIELVGQPDQTSAQWHDDYSLAELAEAGPHIAEWSRKFDIPLRWLTVAQVADGESRGLCTHHDVSRAFPAVSTGHWDPGPNFPKAEALRIWSPPPPLEEFDMDEATFKRLVREVLNEATGKGKKDWATTVEGTLASVQGHTNKLNDILARLAALEAKVD